MLIPTITLACSIALGAYFDLSPACEGEVCVASTTLNDQDVNPSGSTQSTVDVEGSRFSGCVEKADNNNVFSASDKLNIKMKIFPIEADVGKEVDIVIVAVSDGKRYAQNNNGKFIYWDGKISTLTVADTQILQQENDIDVISNEAVKPGVYMVFLGYRMEGVITYHPNGLNFTVI